MLCARTYVVYACDACARRSAQTTTTTVWADRRINGRCRSPATHNVYYECAVKRIKLLSQHITCTRCRATCTSTRTLTSSPWRQRAAVASAASAALPAPTSVCHFSDVTVVRAQSMANVFPPATNCVRIVHACPCDMRTTLACNACAHMCVRTRWVVVVVVWHGMAWHRMGSLMFASQVFFVCVVRCWESVPAL